MPSRSPRTADSKPDFSGMWGGKPACLAARTARTHKGQETESGQRERRSQHSLSAPRALRILTDDYYKRLIQFPGRLVILSERNTTYRQIFTDGRPLPADPKPSWNGYSSGKWDGDTLVVQTIGSRDDLWLDSDGNPLTSAAKVTERFRRPNYGKLEIEITVDDPKAYTAPWTIKLNQPLVLDSELLDYVCLENEKDSAHMVGK
jgi:hypothetical protein